VFDDIRLHVDHARNELPVGRQRVFFERLVGVLVTWVRPFDHERTDVRPVYLADHAWQFDVPVMRTGIVPPTGVKPDSVGRETLERTVDRLYVCPNRLAKLLGRGVFVRQGVAGQHVRRVDLKRRTRLEYRLVLGVEGVREVEQVLLGGGVVVRVREPQHRTRRGRRVKPTGELGVFGLDRVGEPLELTLKR
jgi:hypothetical protein